jgi:hypothetical protein
LAFGGFDHGDQDAVGLDDDFLAGADGLQQSCGTMSGRSSWHLTFCKLLLHP